MNVNGSVPFYLEIGDAAITGSISEREEGWVLVSAHQLDPDHTENPRSLNVTPRDTVYETASAAMAVVASLALRKSRAVREEY